MTTTHRPRSRRSRARTFALHYLQMIVAMVVGMMLLYPLWMLATAGLPADAWVHRTDVESLVMATTMVIPMAAWMRVRRHGWRPVVEMSTAMYAGFVVPFPFLWLGAIDADGLMLLGHVLMLLLMLAAMLARAGEYSGSHAHHGHAATDRKRDRYPDAHHLVGGSGRDDRKARRRAQEHRVDHGRGDGLPRP